MATKALKTAVAAASLLMGLAHSAMVAAEEPAAVPKKEKEERVCKRIVPTGSMFATRFCLTRKDWVTFNVRNQDSAHAALRQRGTGTCDIHCG